MSGELTRLPAPTAAVLDPLYLSVDLPLVWAVSLRAAAGGVCV